MSKCLNGCFAASFELSFKVFKDFFQFSSTCDLLLSPCDLTKKIWFVFRSIF